MPDPTSSPVFVNANPVPERTIERTLSAAPLGLSSRGQVVYIDAQEQQIVSRFQRMRRVVTGASRQITDAMQKGGFRYRAAFITLTYAPGQEWQPKDISKLLDHYRQWLRIRGARLRCVWVMELQKRGAPHYHLVLWLPRGLTPPKPDKQGWWRKGMTNCQWARNPTGYLAKYASKSSKSGGAMPRGARMHGVYGCPRALGWYRAPGWLRKIAQPGMNIRRRKGGWWCVWEFATAWRSPWRVAKAGSKTIELYWVGWRNLDIIDLWSLEQHLAIEDGGSV